jgi:carbon starvation protein
LISTALVVFGWAWFMNSDSFSTIWKMFGIANQTLAVIALSVLSAWLANEGRARFVWVTLMPMAIVIVTTSTAATIMLKGNFDTISTQFEKGTGGSAESVQAMILGGLVLAMVSTAAIVVVTSLARVRRALAGEVVAANMPAEAGAV